MEISIVQNLDQIIKHQIIQMSTTTMPVRIVITIVHYEFRDLELTAAFRKLKITWEIFQLFLR